MAGALAGPQLITSSSRGEPLFMPDRRVSMKEDGIMEDVSSDCSDYLRILSGKISSAQGGQVVGMAIGVTAR